MDYNSECLCLSKCFLRQDTPLDDFAYLREQCPVIKQIFIPDKIWPCFRKKCSAEPDIARHQSIILSAFSNGVLNRITSPIHRYLFDGPCPRNTLNKQYKRPILGTSMFLRPILGTGGYWVQWFYDFLWKQLKANSAIIKQALLLNRQLNITIIFSENLWLTIF